jgi:hypothetical protein
VQILSAPSISGSERRELRLLHPGCFYRAKDLPSHLTLLESALPRLSSHKLFIIATYAAHSDVWETKDLQAQKFMDNSFVINTYEHPSEVWKTKNL